MSTKLIYNIILDNFFKYLPSIILVIFNSLFIVPFFVHVLSTKEVGIYQIIIGILNLLCTCSSDWIAKSSLRFYEKYKLQDKLPQFFSNILFISIFTYFLIFISFILFGGIVSEKLFIPQSTLALILILIIPCGFRQFLYQMLRIFNKPFLYTFSIVIYQLAHLSLFLLLFNICDNLKAILISMTLSMVVIDFYIVKKIQMKTSLIPHINSNMIKECLIYSIPTIFTNTCLWMLLHLNKFIFQRAELFDYTAIAGIAWVYTSYILTPLLSTFLFAVFPIIIKKFENNREIKSATTGTIQLFCILFLPIVTSFILYSKEITNTVFPLEYKQAFIIIPFFALTIFLHELMKIFNIKYHLQNKTYVEMLITLFSAIICIFLNIKLIPMFNLLGAGIAMIISIITLFGLNSLIHFKNFDYINPYKIFKTNILSISIGAAIYCIINFVWKPEIQILAPIIYLLLFYTIIWKFKNRILN